MLRTIVIGDVHGCLDELKELIDKINYDPHKDRLVFLCDFLDRGLFSAETVKFCRENKFESVLGNHEHKYIKHYLKRKKAEADGTLDQVKPMSDDKQAIYDQLSEEDFEYMRHLPLWIDLGNNWVAVHAGFTPHPLDQQNINCIYIRYLDPITLKHKSLGPNYSQPPNTIYWDQLWNQNFNVVYGHSVHSLESPRFAVSKKTGKLCIGIDTGCAFGGFLTSLIIHDEFNFEFCQVKARKEYMKRSF